MTTSDNTMLQRVLQEAFDNSASDLFLLPGEPPTFRVNGQLHRSDAKPLAPQDIDDVAASLVGEGKVDSIGRERADVVTSCGIDGVVDGRACIARAMGNLTIVIRLLPRQMLTPKELGVPQAALAMVESPSGLAVISGPAGSGKTTTLLALLEHLNATRPVHIRTVENPLTYRFTPKRAIIMQQEVGRDTPSTLAGIKTAMLQDLDVLMVGELRTSEELQACIMAAETGHMVIVQIYAESPARAIVRMLDAMPEELKPTLRRSLGSHLRGVLTQHLLAEIGGGRLAAYELLIPDAELCQSLQDGGDIMVRRSPWPAGCQTLRESVERLLAAGRISEQVAKEAVANSPA